MNDEADPLGPAFSIMSGLDRALETGHARVQRLLLRREIVLADAAKRADPIGRDVFKSSAGGDAAIRISGLGVVRIAADVANVLFHDGRIKGYCLNDFIKD